MYLYIYIFTYIYIHIYIMYTTSCVLGIYIIFNISRPLMCTHVYNCRYNYIYIHTIRYMHIYTAVEQNWFRIKSPAGEEPMVNHTHSRLPITRITRCSNGHLSCGSHGKVLNHQRLMVNDADEKWMITIIIAKITMGDRLVLFRMRFR